MILQTYRGDGQSFSKENMFLVVMKVLIFLPLLLTQHLSTSYVKVDRDDVHGIRNDHKLGRWEN